MPVVVNLSEVWSGSTSSPLALSVIFRLLGMEDVELLLGSPLIENAGGGRNFQAERIFRESLVNRVFGHRVFAESSVPNGPTSRNPSVNGMVLILN